MLEIEKYKTGIKIKKSNRGKFTSYCGGEVTSACIQRGKNSSDPAVRKRATFAANARKWKHQYGGSFSAKNPMPQDNTKVLDANGWNANLRTQRMVEMERTRDEVARRRSLISPSRQASFSPISSSELQRRENQRKQAQLYRNTYHTWQIDPTRPYPKTDLEMIGAFNYAGTVGEPIRHALSIVTGAAAGKLIVNTGRDIVQSFATPLGRALWGGAAKNMLQFWKPSSSSMVNIGKTYIIGDEVVAPAIDKGLDIYYKSQEPSLNVLYNGILTNLRVLDAINNGDEGLKKIYTD